MSLALEKWKRQKKHKMFGEKRMSKMECIAIQKHPSAGTKCILVSELEDNSDNNTTGCGRQCSQGRHDVFIGILLLLLLLAFVSQCALFMYIRNIGNELETLRNHLKNEEMIDANDVMNDFLHEKKFIEDALSKSRKRKERSSSCPRIPHFYIKGDGKEDYGKNRILWDAQSGGIDSSNFVADSANGPAASIKIDKAGVYFIYIQIALHGRNRDTFPVFPTVGFELRKTNDGSADIVLAKALLTQDEKGVRYGGTNNKRAMDTLSLSGLFYLTSEDELFVTPLDNLIHDYRIQYDINSDTSHFGGFLLQKSDCVG